LLDEGLRLENSGLLRYSEEGLGKGNDILHLRDGVDAVLHGLSVFATCSLENSSDTLNMALGPFTVRLPDNLAKVGEEDDGSKEDNRFLIDNIQFLRNSSCNKSGSQYGSTRLRDEVG